MRLATVLKPCVYFCHCLYFIIFFYFLQESAARDIIIKSQPFIVARDSISAQLC